MIEKIILYLIPIMLFIWVGIGIFISKKKIHFPFVHSPGLKKQTRRILDLKEHTR